MSRKLKLAALLLGLLGAVAPATTLAQITGLWGVSLNGFNSGSPGPSSLYSIDPVTGAGALVGTNLGYAVNAIAVDPTTGVMYASTTSWSGAFNGLLRVDPATGTATEVGPFGDTFASILGLTFDSSGQLWGWHDPGADDPVRIDKTTGAATTVGDAGISTAGQVLAFDSSDVLYLIQSSSVYTIDQTTGAAVSAGSLSFDPGSGGAAFDPATGLLWASGTSGSTQDSVIRISDVAGDSFTDLDTDVEYLHALTFGGAVSVAAQPVPLLGHAQLLTLGLLLAGAAALILQRRTARARA